MLLFHFHPLFFLVIKICIYISFRLLLCLVFSLASAAGSLGEGGRRNKKYKQSITRLIAKRERESRVIASDSIIDRVVVVRIETLAASSFERSQQSVEDAVIQQ